MNYGKTNAMLFELTYKRKIPLALTALVLAIFMISCTKLDTKVYDQVVSFWNTPQQIAAGVAPAYAGLRNAGPGWPFGPNMYSLNETSTDEIIVPVRGSDWNDYSSWMPMWKHTWSAEHQLVLYGWQLVYGSTGIPRVNNILQAVNELSPAPPKIKEINAELETIRAYYHFVALDLFGNVPIIDSNRFELPVQRSRQDVFSFVENELQKNINFLSADITPSTYGRATQWFSKALLAKLYLNAEVYTGTPRWADCIAACDAILDGGKFILEPNFFENFKIANETSRENIFVLPFDRVAGLDVFLIQLLTLHYSNNKTFGLESGGANGFCTTIDFLNQFDPDDIRKRMFLVGQQYENQIRDPAYLQYDRTGHPLNFDPVITKFDLSNEPIIETAGARCAKWEFNKSGGGNMSNDFAIFRLADIVLTKAEAQFRLGDIPGALATLNRKFNGVSIRSRALQPDFTAAEINADGILRERARELAWEGWRRNDMIRLGHFTDARVPEKEVSAEYRKLFPIPQSEIAKNPGLKQNPGY
jgi:hypothetical protein